jgi:hypothetical protein
MADRLNVKIHLNMTNAADGSEFFDAPLTWSGVPYADAVRMQVLLLGVLDELKKWGEAKANAKKS